MTTISPGNSPGAYGGRVVQVELEDEAAEQLELARAIDDVGGGRGRSKCRRRGRQRCKAAYVTGGGSWAASAAGSRVGHVRGVYGEDVAVVGHVEGLGRELQVVALADDGELAGEASIDVVDSGTLEGVAAGDEVGDAGAGAGGKGGVGDAGIGGEIAEVAAGEVGDAAADGGGDGLAILRGQRAGKQPAVGGVGRKLIGDGELAFTYDSGDETAADVEVGAGILIVDTAAAGKPEGNERSVGAVEGAVAAVGLGRYRAPWPRCNWRAVRRRGSRACAR